MRGSSLRPPRHPGALDGFLHLQQYRRGRGVCLEKKGLERVAVIDFDVHHGNGTEDMFSPPQWQKRVLMASFFQHPFYPYSGTANPAPNMINVPLAAGSGGAAAKKAVETQWLPALEKFQAADDFHFRRVRCAPRRPARAAWRSIEADYAWMTRELKQVAARHSQGRIVSMLEGGYNLSALGRSAVAHVRALAERLRRALGIKSADALGDAHRLS